MQESRFDAAAWWVYHHGFRPDHITFSQSPVYIAMAYSAIVGQVWAFLALQVLVVLLDGADGILARRTGTVTRRGHLLDAFYDILGIGITLWAAAVLYPNAQSILMLPPLGQLLLALLVVNFLVYIQNEIQGTKSITYTRGPVTLGIVLEQYFPGFLVIGVLLPLVFGIGLLFTRLDWRRRLFNWYQFITAGRRKEYKALPRTERAGYARHPARFPPPVVRVREPSARSEDQTGDEPEEEKPAEPRL